ncbi:hypothetical protein [Sulfitobacter sp. 1A12157]|uniref:hypothetical protein n=1 Tax=Sulfitobacter sp. 1A12157 TaxID=3368594 RepID=UPI0037466EBF
MYSLPAGYLATDGQVASASQHNEPLEDIKNDLNDARPITAGGTGATSAADARANLLSDSVNALIPLTPAADRLAYYTADDEAALTPLTAFARGLLDDADAATMRGTVGAADRVWQVKTGAYTAIAGDRIIADTSAGAFTVTLPASPNAGDDVWFSDAGLNWFTNNNLTVDGNGSDIDGAATFAADADGGYFTAIFDGTEWQVRLTGGSA